MVDFLVGPAYGRYGDICADDGAVEQAILSKAKSLATDLGVDYLEIRNVNAIDDSELFGEDI